MNNKGIAFIGVVLIFMGVSAIGSGVAYIISSDTYCRETLKGFTRIRNGSVVCELTEERVMELQQETCERIWGKGKCKDGIAK